MSRPSPRPRLRATKASPSSAIKPPTTAIDRDEPRRTDPARAWEPGTGPGSALVWGATTNAEPYRAAPTLIEPRAASGQMGGASTCGMQRLVELGHDDPIAVRVGDLVGRVGRAPCTRGTTARGCRRRAADRSSGSPRSSSSLIVSMAWIDPMMPGQHAEHAGLGAAGRHLGRRGLGHHVAIGGSALRIEHGDHALEPEDGPVHDRDAELHRRVVHEEARGEVVGAVDDHVPPREDVHHVVGAEAHVVGDHVDVGVEEGEGLLGGVDLAVADSLDVVEDLALEVRLVDDVHVDDADRADACRRQVERGGRTEAARAEQEHPRVEQLLLPGDVDLGEEDVPLVPVALLGGEAPRGRPLRGSRPSTC